MGVFTLLYEWAKDGHGFPMIGSGDNKYQLLDVEDLCDVIITCFTIEAEKMNDTFNIGAKEFTDKLGKELLSEIVTQIENLVFDDLKKHADVYREISLTSKKTPGRDAYPADIFYTHSRLLEKGCQHKNGGSITILPVVETKGGDITDYVSTNIISITDGQIVLSEKNFKKGQKPAINYGVSVSRLGGAVQSKDVKKLGEEAKVACRNIRRDINEQLKKLEKNSEISEDQLKDFNEEVQKLTDKYTAKCEELAKDKEKQVMQI